LEKYFKRKGQSKGQSNKGALLGREIIKSSANEIAEN